MNEVYRVRNKEIKNVQRKVESETKLKEQAISKMEELRSEI